MPKGKVATSARRKKAKSKPHHGDHGLCFQPSTKEQTTKPTTSQAPNRVSDSREGRESVSSVLSIHGMVEPSLQIRGRNDNSTTPGRNDPDVRPSSDFAACKDTTQTAERRMEARVEGRRSKKRERPGRREEENEEEKRGLKGEAMRRVVCAGSSGIFLFFFFPLSFFFLFFFFLFFFFFEGDTHNQSVLFSRRNSPRRKRAPSPTWCTALATIKSQLSGAEMQKWTPGAGTRGARPVSPEG